MRKEVNNRLSVCKTEGYNPRYLEIQSTVLKSLILGAEYTW